MTSSVAPSATAAATVADGTSTPPRRHPTHNSSFIGLRPVDHSSLDALDARSPTSGLTLHSNNDIKINTNAHMNSNNHIDGDNTDPVADGLSVTIITDDSAAAAASGAASEHATADTCEEAYANPPCSMLSIIPGPMRVEARRVLALALPLMLGFVAQNAVSVINLIFVGHEGENELAASSVAMLFCNVTGLSLLFGMLGTIDTLASQAYGAGNFKRVGVVLQRALCIVTLQAMLTIVLWSFSHPLLSAVGIEPEVAEMAAKFIYVMMAALLPQAYLNALQRYLQCQGNTKPVMVVTIISVATVPLLNYLLIIVAELGYIGAAVTTVVSQTFALLLMLGYVLYSGFYKKTWGGWSREAFREWREYLALGLPGVGMMCAEWWGFEIHTLVAAQLGTAALAAQSIVISLTGLVFMVPMAVGIAAATLTGTAFGANKPKQARWAGMAALMICLCGQALIALVLTLTSSYVGYVFTSEKDVVTIVASAVPILSLFVMFDGFQGTASGILRGAGMQNIGFYINVTAYWVYTLPVAYVLAFHAGHWDRPVKDPAPGAAATERVSGLGVPGQWIALTSASVGVVITMVVFLKRLNWDQVAAKVCEREAAATAAAAAAALAGAGAGAGADSSSDASGVGVGESVSSAGADDYDAVLGPQDRAGVRDWGDSELHSDSARHHVSTVTSSTSNGYMGKGFNNEDDAKHSGYALQDKSSDIEMQHMPTQAGAGTASVPVSSTEGDDGVFDVAQLA